MSHRVVMLQPALRDAPRAIRDEAHSRFEQIAKGLGDVPADNALWASVRVSRLCLVVDGWSFMYELDGETLRVTGVRRPRQR